MVVRPFRICFLNMNGNWKPTHGLDKAFYAGYRRLLATLLQGVKTTHTCPARDFRFWIRARP